MEELVEGEGELPAIDAAGSVAASFAAVGPAPVLVAVRGRPVADAPGKHQAAGPAFRLGGGAHPGAFDLREQERDLYQADAACAADPTYQAGMCKAKELRDEGIFTAAEFQKEVALLARQSRERNGKFVASSAPRDWQPRAE